MRLFLALFAVIFGTRAHATALNCQGELGAEYLLILDTEKKASIFERQENGWQTRFVQVPFGASQGTRLTIIAEDQKEIKDWKKGECHRIGESTMSFRLDIGVTDVSGTLTEYLGLKKNPNAPKGCRIPQPAPPRARQLLCQKI